MKKKFLTSVAVLFVLLSIKAEVLCNYVENESLLDIHMIYVEGGTFQMGTNKDRNREIDEENVHSVTLDDFYIGKNSNVVIVAGCGIHSDLDADAEHDGIHRFHLEESSYVKYTEKH